MTEETHVDTKQVLLAAGVCWGVSLHQQEPQRSLMFITSFCDITNQRLGSVVFNITVKGGVRHVVCNYC